MAQNRVTIAIGQKLNFYALYNPRKLILYIPRPFRLFGFLARYSSWSDCVVGDAGDFEHARETVSTCVPCLLVIFIYMHIYFLFYLNRDRRSGISLVNVFCLSRERKYYLLWNPKILMQIINVFLTLCLWPARTQQKVLIHLPTHYYKISLISISYLCALNKWPKWK